MTKKNQTEEMQVRDLCTQICKGYFGAANLQPLLDHLAPDVWWLGSGEDMDGQGRDSVAAAFRRAQEQAVPAKMSQERCDVRPLAPGLWLTQFTCFLEMYTAYRMTLNGHERCIIVFRRTAGGTGPQDWEIVYLNTSLAYERFRKGEMFLLSESTRNYRNLHESSQDVLTNAAKERLYRVIERHVRSLTPDQQEALVAASVYRSFTIDQIYDLCRDLVSREELIQYCSEASFLIYDYKKGAYSFHPLMRLYVRNRFNELPQEKRNAIYERAARWFQKQEEYRECIAYAFRGQADELALEAVEAGGAHSLVGFSVDRVLALLHRLDHKMRAKHLGGCQLMILYATLNSAQSAAASERESLTASLPPDYEPTPSEWAGFWVLKGISAVPDLKAMLPYFRRARTLCQVAGVQLPRDFFDGVTRGVAGQLFLYYRGPGQLQDNVRDLTEIYECCGVIMKGVDAESWIAVLQGEVSYMTGHFEPAYDFTKRLSLAGYRSDDQREQAAVALSLLPRILLFEGQKEEFSAWIDYYHVLEKEMTTPVWKADLEIVADFIRALLEQPTEEIKQTLEKYLKWSPYPSLNPMWQTTRHRLVMKAGRFQTIDITGPTPIPSGTSLYSQTNRMYDNIAYVVAELNLGHR